MEDMFTEINCKKSYKTNTGSWKKTLKTIHQLSCFVGHPVHQPCNFSSKTRSLLFKPWIILPEIFQLNLGVYLLNLKFSFKQWSISLIMEVFVKSWSFSFKTWSFSFKPCFSFKPWSYSIKPQSFSFKQFKPWIFII